MSDIGSATDDLIEWANYLRERFPEMDPAIDEKLAEAAQMVNDIFQPLIDFGEGRITREEYDAIRAERDARDIAERQAMWGEADARGQWHVRCQDCSRSLDLDELPEQYPTCEDIDEECEDLDDLD